MEIMKTYEEFNLRNLFPKKSGEDLIKEIQENFLICNKHYKLYMVISDVDQLKILNKSLSILLDNLYKLDKIIQNEKISSVDDPFGEEVGPTKTIFIEFMNKLIYMLLKIPNMRGGRAVKDYKTLMIRYNNLAVEHHLDLIEITTKKYNRK